MKLLQKKFSVMIRLETNELLYHVNATKVLYAVKTISRMFLLMFSGENSLI